MLRAAGSSPSRRLPGNSHRGHTGHKGAGWQQIARILAERLTAAAAAAITAAARRRLHAILDSIGYNFRRLIPWLTRVLRQIFAPFLVDPLIHAA
jgi:hypothetical protein